MPAERETEIVDELAMQLEATYERERHDGASHDAAMAAANAEVPDWTALARTLTAITPARHHPPPGGTQGGFMNGFAGDIRSALRGLRRTPAFTIVAIATLALGLGMAAAAFSVIDPVLIKLLRFASPIAGCWCTPPCRPTAAIPTDRLPTPWIARETQAFCLRRSSPHAGTATALDPPARVTGYNVTPSMLPRLACNR